MVAGAVAPQAAVAVAFWRGKWQVQSAAADRRGPPSPGSEPVFDLASVSKPVLAAAAARLVERGVLQWTTPIGQLLPEIAATESAAASVEALLSHRAGLRAHAPLYDALRAGRAVRRSEALQRAAASRQRTPAPDEAVYSDLGYLLLGAALERRLHLPLDVILDQQVSTPLRLDLASARQWLARMRDFLPRVAPTENVAWRGGLLRGSVHDENAWALAGHGACGHAGLFGTAAGVARFGAAVLDALHGRSSWLSQESAALMTRPRRGGTLRAGFDGKAGPDSMAGRRAGPRTFGHLGFTGTSLWCDPDVNAVTVLLTNRVCPTREHVAIRRARPLAHDALFAHVPR